MARRFSGTGQRTAKSQAPIARCEFATVNAEEIRWRDYFDSVFSLNVMEHAAHPERVLAELHRILRAGCQALIQFSSLYHSDSGSHLPPTLGYNRPWAQLVRRQSVLAVVPFEVDNILTTLNGSKPAQFDDLFENKWNECLGRVNSPRVHPSQRRAIARIPQFEGPLYRGGSHDHWHALALGKTQLSERSVWARRNVNVIASVFSV